MAVMGAAIFIGHPREIRHTTASDLVLVQLSPSYLQWNAARRKNRGDHHHRWHPQN